MSGIEVTVDMSAGVDIGSRGRHLHNDSVHAPNRFAENELVRAS